MDERDLIIREELVEIRKIYNRKFKILFCDQKTLQKGGPTLACFHFYWYTAKWNINER